MKKIILTLLISTISIYSFAGIFQSSIPQPDFMSNDWDGDGDPNITDPDDDNDGVLDDDDSNPFDLNGQNSTPAQVEIGSGLYAIEISQNPGYADTTNGFSSNPNYATWGSIINNPPLSTGAIVEKLHINGNIIYLEVDNHDYSTIIDVTIDGNSLGTPIGLTGFGGSHDALYWNNPTVASIFTANVGAILNFDIIESPFVSNYVDPIRDGSWTQIATSSAPTVNDSTWLGLRNGMTEGILIVLTNGTEVFSPKDILISASCKNIMEVDSIATTVLLAWEEVDCNAGGSDYDAVTIGSGAAQPGAFSTGIIYALSRGLGNNSLFPNYMESSDSIQAIYIK
jgi:hypothetical protein